jgi:hypothetical protein
MSNMHRYASQYDAYYVSLTDQSRFRGLLSFSLEMSNLSYSIPSLSSDVDQLLAHTKISGI